MHSVYPIAPIHSIAIYIFLHLLCISPMSSISIHLVLHESESPPLSAFNPNFTSHPQHLCRTSSAHPRELRPTPTGYTGNNLLDRHRWIPTYKTDNSRIRQAHSMASRGPSSASSSRSASRTPQAQRAKTTSPSSSSSGNNQSAASYFSYPVSHVMSGLYRRFTDQAPKPSLSTMGINTSTSPEVFTPVRTASPFQPPPLTPLTLSSGTETDPQTSSLSSLQQQLLSRALAEEIRLLVPARLQLVDTWRLAYSLDRDGASLSTLFANCSDYAQRSPRAGFVLVVRDASPNGAVFGAYMTDPPHPSTHYFGTGECFLWRSSVLPPPNLMGITKAAEAAAGSDVASPPSEDLLELAGLPPPPSADTTNAGRWSTLRGDPKRSTTANSPSNATHLAPPRSQSQTPTLDGRTSGTSTPDRIRFKAFPYSGVNDYMMFCETGFLSLGGG